MEFADGTGRVADNPCNNAYALRRDLPKGSGFGAGRRQATQASDCTTPSSISAPGRSAPKRPARRDRAQCPANAAVRAATIPTTTCGMADVLCRRASSPALAPPKTPVSPTGIESRGPSKYASRPRIDRPSQRIPPARRMVSSMPSPPAVGPSAPTSRASPRRCRCSNSPAHRGPLARSEVLLRVGTGGLLQPMVVRVLAGTPRCCSPMSRSVRLWFTQ